MLAKSWDFYPALGSHGRFKRGSDGLGLTFLKTPLAVACVCVCVCVREGGEDPRREIMWTPWQEGSRQRRGVDPHSIDLLRFFLGFWLRATPCPGF